MIIIKIVLPYFSTLKREYKKTYKIKVYWPSNKFRKATPVLLENGGLAETLFPLQKKDLDKSFENKVVYLCQT